MSYRETCSPCPPDAHALPEQFCFSDYPSYIPTLWFMGILRGKEGECRVLQVFAWGAAPALFSTSPGTWDRPGGADPPGGWWGPGTGSCGCVGPCRVRGASLQLPSQKEPCLSPLPSPRQCLSLGQGEQTALRCCNTCPSSPQSLLHHPLTHRHLVPATNLSQGRAWLIWVVTCCCNRLSPPPSSLLAGPRALPGSGPWSCSGVISAVLP